MNDEVKLILTKLKIVSEEKENGAYICDKKHSKLLLSYIEQLETDYKETIESVTWWRNRYNAIVKQNDDNHKKVVKLENNRDKAIEKCKNKQYETNHEWLKRFAKELENILKGDSDD